VPNHPAKQLTCGAITAPVKSTDGRLRLQVLVARGSIEVFAGGGAVAMSVARPAAESVASVSITGRGDEAVARSLTVWQLESPW
jgi:sucrose-6-phosphate hydrolase SacC (GH32 family)